MQSSPLAATVIRRMQLSTDTGGAGLPLMAEVAYDPADPMAVTMTFHTGGSAIPWTFARELLDLGRHQCAGQGDVRLWPANDHTGCTMIRLQTPEATVTLSAWTRDLDAFVHAMYESVPPGREHVDLDAELARLLA